MLAVTRLEVTPFVPEIVLHLAEDITELWERTGAEQPPFWAFAWAGGQAVARYVLDNRDLVAGRTVFDLASGSGLVAVAAARAGAGAVTACDLDPLAATAMGINARANDVSITPLLADVLDEDTDAEVVLAGDVFYDKDMSARVLPFLERAAARGALVLVGDPSRPYLPRSRFEVAAHYSVPVPRDLEGVRVLPTAVWSLTAR